MRLTRATPPLLKDLNQRTVLDAIRDGAPISRAEISRRVGISKPTVSQALQSLRQAGLVREAADDPGGPSYGAVFFEPVAEAALVLGLDLGARFLRGAICDLVGVVRARQAALPRLDSLEKPFFELPETQAQLAYAGSLSAVAYILDIYGEEGVQRLIAALATRYGSDAAADAARASTRARDPPATPISRHVRRDASRAGRRTAARSRGRTRGPRTRRTTRDPPGEWLPT